MAGVERLPFAGGDERLDPLARSFTTSLPLYSIPKTLLPTLSPRRAEHLRLGDPGVAAQHQDDRVEQLIASHLERRAYFTSR